jgi:hypothetical protein
VQFPFIPIHIQDIRFITTLQVLDWGGVLEYYIWFSLRSRSLQFYLLLLPIFLYLDSGLIYIPYGLLSCRSLSLIIFLHIWWTNSTPQFYDRLLILITLGKGRGASDIRRLSFLRVSDT